MHFLILIFKKKWKYRSFLTSVMVCQQSQWIEFFLVWVLIKSCIPFINEVMSPETHYFGNFLYCDFPCHVAIYINSYICLQNLNYKKKGRACVAFLGSLINLDLKLCAILGKMWQLVAELSEKCMNKYRKLLAMLPIVLLCYLIHKTYIELYL